LKDTTMNMQRLLILRGLPEALKAFRSDKDFEGRLVEALRTHLSAGPRDSLYYQDRGTEDGQAFVIYLFNRADPSAPGIPIYPGDENMYRVPYAVTPGGALEFSFGAPEKVRERRDYVPEGEIAKAGPVANRPGLALDPLTHRWKKVGGMHDGDAMLQATDRRNMLAQHLKSAGYNVRHEPGHTGTTYIEHGNKTAAVQTSDDGDGLIATHHHTGDAMDSEWHGIDHHEDMHKFIRGLGHPAEALKAKAKGDNLTMDMFGGGAPAAAKPAATEAAAAPGLMEPRKGEVKAQEHDAQRQAHLDAAARLSGSPLGSPGHALHSDHMNAANLHGFAAKEHRGFADEGVKNAASAKARAASAQVGATPGDPTHGGRLVAQKVTDRAGHQTTRYKKTGEADTPVKVKDAQAGVEHKIPQAPAKTRGKAETEALATAAKAGPVADGTADWQMSDAHHAASQRHLAAARALYDAADKVKDPTEMKALGDAHSAAAEAHSKARKQHDADRRKESSPEGERLTKIANEASAAAAAAHPEAKARALHGLHPST
jgi:hypothetical protein